MDTSSPDRASWDQKARDWHEQVGSEGDLNRRINSDPVLWRLAGDVQGLDVLDAGCGTGYLAIKLAREGARVQAVDFSPAMIEVARENVAAAGASIRLEVDSISEMRTIETAAFDLVISNYVLMDCADLDGAIGQFHRVLRSGGRVVAVFSHPCFDRAEVPEHPEGGPVYHWAQPHYDEVREESCWGRFTSPFVFYHRPLRSYWQCFHAHGFQVTGFDEPVAEPPFPAEMSAAQIARTRSRPFSVAFQLAKGPDKSSA
jgi:SAM-dependent methyltransferase